jgi:hypothetical protein
MGNHDTKHICDMPRSLGGLIACIWTQRDASQRTDPTTGTQLPLQDLDGGRPCVKKTGNVIGDGRSVVVAWNTSDESMVW